VKDRLHELEQIARRLDPDEGQRAEWRRAVDAHLQSFLSQLDRAPAYVPDFGPRDGLLARPFKDESTSIDDVLTILTREVERHGINPASARAFGYIPGGGIYYSALGDYLADVFNRYAGVFYASPGAIRMENMLIRWMNDLVGYPAGAHGNLTTSGSLANMIAMVVARDGKNIKAADIPRSVIYLSKQTHHSVQKAVVRPARLPCPFRCHWLPHLCATEGCSPKMPFAGIAGCRAVKIVLTT